MTNDFSDLPTTLPKALAVTLEKGGSGEPDVRKFSAEEINKRITDAFTIQPDAKVVGYAFLTETGAHFAIAGKLPDKIPGEGRWTLWAEHPLEAPDIKKMSAGGGIMWWSK